MQKESAITRTCKALIIVVNILLKLGKHVILNQRRSEFTVISRPRNPLALM